MTKTPLKETPSQTAGPYLHIGCLPATAGLSGRDLGTQMFAPQTQGDRIDLTGRILDGEGAPLTDAMVELWQADAAGRYGPRDDGFTGWGRQACDPDTGLFRFQTIKPGSTQDPNGRIHAPHGLLWIVARGINLGLTTRVYFAGDKHLQATDPVLALLGARAHTLIAAPTKTGFHIDIHLQGPSETVFFDV